MQLPFHEHEQTQFQIDPAWAKAEVSHAKHHFQSVQSLNPAAHCEARAAVKLQRLCVGCVHVQRGALYGCVMLTAGEAGCKQLRACKQLSGVQDARSCSLGSSMLVAKLANIMHNQKRPGQRIHSLKYCLHMQIWRAFCQEACNGLLLGLPAAALRGSCQHRQNSSSAQHKCLQQLHQLHQSTAGLLTYACPSEGRQHPQRYYVQLRSTARLHCITHTQVEQRQTLLLCMLQLAMHMLHT